MSVFPMVHHVWHSGMNDAGMATAINYTAVAGNNSIWTMLYPGVSPTHYGLLVTTATVDGTTTIGVAALYRRVTYGSDTGRIEVATITIPTAPAGTLILCRIAGGRIIPGTQLVSATKVAGAGGGAAGAYQPLLYVVNDPEQWVMMPNVVLVN